MSRRSQTLPWAKAILGTKDRLREPLVWLPFPALISIGIVLILTAYILSGTNPRLGHPASVITLPSAPHRDGSIWFSITPIGDEVVVTTGDRQVFRWPLDVGDLSALKPFGEYLKQVVAHEIESAALSHKAYEHQTTAVIAVDQTLKFRHIRPVLYALADAGIARYGFETQSPALAQSAPQTPPSTLHHH